MDVFIGSLMLVPYNFPPLGWAFCQGQLLPLSSNTALFSLLGTTYGGNGTTNFALPNLQGNLAVGAGQGPGLSNYQLGQIGGAPTASLLGTPPLVPPHSHGFMGTESSSNSATPTSCALARPGTLDLVYSNATSPLVPMNAAMVQPAGGNTNHNNMMPYLGLNWIIALTGIYPSRS